MDDFQDKATDEPKAPEAPKAKTAGKAGLKALRKYDITVRHSPALLKHAVVEAADEDDAWEQFLKLNEKHTRSKYTDPDAQARFLDAWAREKNSASKTIVPVAA